MPVHKIVLAAYSKFFENMFTKDFNGSKYEKENILRQIEPNALELIIDFMYTTKLQINEQNVQVKLYFKVISILLYQNIQDVYCTAKNSKTKIFL